MLITKQRQIAMKAFNEMSEKTNDFFGDSFLFIRSKSYMMICNSATSLSMLTQQIFPVLA